MGIYDREYYRERTRGSGWFSGATPACKWIIIANIVCFLLPALPARPEHLRDWFAAYSRLISSSKGQVWRLITATFLHNPDNSGTSSGTCSSSGSSAARWSRSTGPRNSSGSTSPPPSSARSAGPWSTIATSQDHPDGRRLGRDHGRGLALHVLQPAARDHPLHLPGGDVAPADDLRRQRPLGPARPGRARSMAFAAHLGGFGYAVAF